MYTVCLQPREGKALGQFKRASLETWGSLPKTQDYKLAELLTGEDSGGLKFDLSSSTFYFLPLCICHCVLVSELLDNEGSSRRTLQHYTGTT